MKSLWQNWKYFSHKIGAAGHKFLFLDFDGTLVPISKKPESVVLKDETKNIILEICRKKDWTVAIISGRSLKDLRSFFRSRHLIYVGNHGLELAGKDRYGRKMVLPKEAIVARRQRRLMNLVAEKLKTAFYFWPGVTVENKRYTLSIHFRNLRDDRRLAFNEMIKFFKDKYAGEPLVWKPAKKVWEVRPFPEWGKGSAVHYLSRKFPDAMPIAVGDDRTDEEMFRAIKGKGIGIRVGRLRNTSARTFVSSTKEVNGLLKKLRKKESPKK